MPKTGMLTPLQCPAPVTCTPDVPAAGHKVQESDLIFFFCYAVLRTGSNVGEDGAEMVFYSNPNNLLQSLFHH